MAFEKLFFSALIVAACTGCVTHSPGNSTGYIDPDEDAYGSSSRMEFSQMRRALTVAVERMLTDPMFSTGYSAAQKRAKAAGRTLPTIAINPIENNTGDGRSDSAAAGQLHRELYTAIRKTGKFEMIDRTRRKQMRDANVNGVDDGEDSLNIQSIGNYTSADFVMTGDLRREATEERRRTVYYHLLNLELTDSASGTLFWSDTVTETKAGRR